MDTNADWCTFVTGDGTGTSGTEQKLPFKVASPQLCALFVHQLHPKANGATYGNGGKCYAEYGMTKSNGNAKWQTCKLEGNEFFCVEAVVKCAYQHWQNHKCT